MKRMHAVLAGLVVFCGGMVSGVAAGQTPLIFEDEHLFASDGAGGDLFGNSISVSGDVAIVGALRDVTAVGTSAGSAYVYRFNGANWVEEAHLFASDGMADDLFGNSVSISGPPGSEVAILGVVGDDTVAGSNAGSAYIYRFNGTNWIEEAHLLASDGAAVDRFGSSVALNGDVAIVGASSDDTAGGGNAGSVYIFRYNGVNWVEEGHLFASDGAAGDELGNSVSISGPPGNEVAIVGAGWDDTNAGTWAGSAYVFRFDGKGWVEEQHLFASDGDSGNRFGNSVSISDNVAIVGSVWDNTPEGNNAGSAYIYRFNGTDWMEEAHFFASDGEENDQFGAPVSITDTPEGAIALVGAFGDDTEAGSSAGSAYVYRMIESIWVEVAHLIASDGATSDHLGTSVDISPYGAFLGALRDDTAGGANSGSVYVYSLLSDCNGNGINDLQDIATDFSINCNGNGVPDECELVGNDANGNGVPDECDPDCNGNGIPDFLEIVSGDVPDCNGNGVPDSCDVDSQFSPDCNLNGIPDECELVENDDNGNGVPDECDQDCNLNGIFDPVELFNGTSLDCNGNGILDECDVASGLSADCNGNLVPDICEVASSDPFQTGKFLAGDGVAGDGFGAALDVEGEVMVVGGRTAIGSPYVYGFDGTSWVETGRLTASDGAALYFDVSIRGNLVIVGAPAANDSGSFTGAAYIFRYNGTTWEEEARLTASDGAASDAFGISVDIEGDRAIVGAWNGDGAAVDTGAVYIFDYDGSSWNEAQKIFASDGVESNFERFGLYTAIQGEIIAVSGDFNDGKTYVFRQQGAIWSEEAILAPVVDAAFQLRGGDVAIEGNVIVSGNAVTSDGSDHIGNIYRYDGTAWNEEAELQAEDIDSFSRGTFSVDLDNGFVLLSTARLAGFPLMSGLSVYGYQYDGAGWVTLPKILAVDAPQGSGIPHYNVALSGDRLVVGTFSDDTQGVNAGAVFLFEGVLGSDCNGNLIPDGCDIASGLSADVDGNGVPDSCQGVVCVADIVVPHNGEVDLLDLIAVLDGFGDCPVTGVCPADIAPLGGGNGVVNIDDLVAVLNAFGGCG